MIQYVLSYNASQHTCPRIKRCAVGLRLYDKQTDIIFDQLMHRTGAGMHDVSFPPCPYGMKHPCSSVDVTIDPEIREMVVPE